MSLGSHDYDWELDKKFFEALENPDVLGCAILVRLTLDKQERMLVLDFNISGYLVVACDRCLDPFNMPVKIGEQFFIKFGETFKEESESVLVIPETEYQFDVSELIFDFISLAIPIKKVHPDEASGEAGCDPETLSRLNTLTLKKGSDPRWDALKNIKLDNN